VTDRLLGFCAAIVAAHAPARLAELLGNLSIVEDMGRVWLFIIALRAEITLVFKRPFGIGALRNPQHQWKNFLKENI